MADPSKENRSFLAFRAFDVRFFSPTDGASYNGEPTEGLFEDHPMCIRLISASLIALSLSAAVLADDNVIRLSEPVASTETYEDFGTALPEMGDAHSLSDAIATMDETASEPVLIQTEVQQVCQKKGCFFIARDGETVARVRFQDYGFFIPTDAAGKRVTLAGRLSRVELSPEQAAHFAEDLGEAAPVPAMAEFEYQIMATAVRIPRA